MGEYVPPKRKTRWAGVILFSVLILFGVIGTPIYIHYYGLSLSEILLFTFYFFATSFSITVGYHRFFSHATFKASPIIQFLLLFFGAATYEQSALKWASLHRQHHQFTDTDLDPHNSKKGFWHSHIGWIIFYKNKFNEDNVKDLMQNKLVMNQRRYYREWALISGIIVPLLIGYVTGHLLGAFLLSVCLRLFLVMNSAFLINSYAHMVGDNHFDKTLSARDHWLGAIATNGEGYHSFHHKFPNDYRNGVLWHHWDPSKWCIYFLSCIGLVWGLKRTTQAKILESIPQLKVAAVY